MYKNKTLTIEKKVLKNYLIHSPSKISIEKKYFRKEYFKNRERLFFDCLKLPKKLFKESTLLDFGCGTGEHDICYAMWGSKLTLIDINPVSTAQVNKYFTKFKLKKSLKKLITNSIYKFKSKNKFDFVISDGVLHHTQDPKRAFNIMAKNLKPGGFCVLEVAFDTSHFQRSLHRFIIDYLSDGSAKKVEKYASTLFFETINRAHKFGGRSRKQIIYDFYTNPKHKGINLFQILSWFKNHNIKYYSSYPSIEPEGFINNLNSETFSEFLKKNNLMTFFQSVYFLMASSDYKNNLKDYKSDAIKLNSSWRNFLKYSKLNDYEYNNNTNLNKTSKLFNYFMNDSLRLFKKRDKDVELKIKKFNKEFTDLIKVLKTKNLILIRKKIKKFSQLFKGYNGVPSNYIVGYKEK